MRHYNFNLNIVFRLWLALHLRKALFGLGWCGNDDQAFAVSFKASGAAVTPLINVFSGVHELAMLGFCILFPAVGKKYDYSIITA
jgi:hypothetical protein